FSSRRRHTRFSRDWSSDVCSSDLVERLPFDRKVARRVEGAWDEIEIALTSALIRAQAQGELSRDKDPRALARFLLVVIQGLRVVGKGHADPDRLRDAAREALTVLDRHRPRFHPPASRLR